MKLTKVFLGFLLFILSSPIHAQKLSSSRRSGIQVNIAPQYFYSRLERQENGGENFSILSDGGIRGELDIWGFMSKSFSLHLKGEFNTYSFEGPAARTFPEPDTDTMMAGLRIQWHIVKDIKFFIQANYVTVIVMDDTTSVIHEFEAVPLTSGSMGLWLTAESNSGFGLDVELFAGSGIGEGEHESDPTNPVTMSLLVGAKSRLSFGERKQTFQWGLQSTVFLQEHEHGDIKYITSNAAGGLFIEANF